MKRQRPKKTLTIFERGNQLHNTARRISPRGKSKGMKKKSSKSKIRFSVAPVSIPKLQRLLTHVEEPSTQSQKRKKKKKGILKIKIETYLKSNPLYKSKQIQTVLKHCRREIGFILTKLKSHLKHNNEKSLKMMGDFDLKQQKLMKLFKIWKKYIMMFFNEKQKRDFHRIFRTKNSSEEEDTFAWTTIIEEEESEKEEINTEKEETNKSSHSSQLVDIDSDSSSSSSIISVKSKEDFEKIKIEFFIEEFFIFLLDFIQVRAGIYLL